jgi:hypothetical protein
MCMALKMPDGPRFCVVTVTFFLMLFLPVVMLSRWIHSRSAIDSASPVCAPGLDARAGGPRSPVPRFQPVFGVASAPGGPGARMGAEGRPGTTGTRGTAWNHRYRSPSAPRHRDVCVCPHSTFAPVALTHRYRGSSPFSASRLPQGPPRCKWEARDGLEPPVPAHIGASAPGSVCVPALEARAGGPPVIFGTKIHGRFFGRCQIFILTKMKKRD